MTTRAIVVAVTTAGLLGCAAMVRQEARSREDALLAAGFVKDPRTTPAAAADLKQLPPRKLMKRTAGGMVTYLYADPQGCQCVYRGTQAAFDTYRRQLQAQDAEEAQADADAWKEQEHDLNQELQEEDADEGEPVY